MLVVASSRRESRAKLRFEGADGQAGAGWLSGDERLILRIFRPCRNRPASLDNGLATAKPATRELPPTNASLTPPFQVLFPLLSTAPWYERYGKMLSLQTVPVARVFDKATPAHSKLSPPCWPARCVAKKLTILTSTRAGRWQSSTVILTCARATDEVLAMSAYLDLSSTVPKRKHVLRRVGCIPPLPARHPISSRVAIWP